MSTRPFFIAIVLSCLIATDVVGQRKREEVVSAERKTGSVAKSKAETQATFLEGEKFFLLEDYERAVQLFEKAAAMDVSPGIRVKWAEALSRTGKQEHLEKAAALIEEVLKKEEKVGEYYLAGARIHAMRNDHADASALLEKMIETVPGSEEWLTELAGYHQLAGRKEKALSALERSEKHFGVSEETSYRKSEILESMGRKQAAEEEFRKLMEQDPDDPRYVMALAELVANRGDVNRAVAVLEAFAARGGDTGYINAMLAEIHLTQGRKDKAYQLAGYVLSDPDVEVEDRISLMRLLVSVSASGKAVDPTEAEQLRQLYNKLAQDPGADVLQLGGDLYGWLGERREAMRLYRQAIRTGNASFQTWTNLFSIESEENQIDSLLAHAELALEFYPAMAEVWYFQGFAQWRKKKYPSACRSLEQALKLNPEKMLKAEIHSLLGESWQALKEFEKSEQSFEASLTLDPDDANVLNNYSYYLALRKTRLSRAEELAARLIRNHPDIPAYADTYAWVLFHLGKFRESRAVLQPIVESGKANATHLEHYGDTLFMLGQSDDAVRMWEKALSMNSQNDALRKKILNRRLN